MNATLYNLIQLRELTLKLEDGNNSSASREEIENLRAGFAESILRRFDHLIKLRRLAVAQLSDSGACRSCHMKIPSADAMRIRGSGHHLATCPFCGCLLYSPKSEFDEATAPTETVS